MFEGKLGKTPTGSIQHEYSGSYINSLDACVVIIQRNISKAIGDKGELLNLHFMFHVYHRVHLLSILHIFGVEARPNIVLAPRSFV